MRQTDIEHGLKPGTSAVENAALREANKRIPLFGAGEPRFSGAAAYLSQANLPGK